MKNFSRKTTADYFLDQVFPFSFLFLFVFDNFIVPLFFPDLSFRFVPLKSVVRVCKMGQSVSSIWLLHFNGLVVSTQFVCQPFDRNEIFWPFASSLALHSHKNATSEKRRPSARWVNGISERMSWKLHTRTQTKFNNWISIRDEIDNNSTRGKEYKKWRLESNQQLEMNEGKMRT